MLYYVLCLSYHSNTEAVLFACLPTQKLFCLHVFRQAGPPQRVDRLAPRRETALSVFRKAQRRATALGVEPRFCNLSITSPAPLLSHGGVALICLLFWICHLSWRRFNAILSTSVLHWRSSAHRMWPSSFGDRMLDDHIGIVNLNIAQILSININTGNDDNKEITKPGAELPQCFVKTFLQFQLF